MASSKPVHSFSVPDTSAMGQHFLECDTEECNKNCQFYCNTCCQYMCQQCRFEHQKSPDSRKHDVEDVSSRKRKEKSSWRNAQAPTTSIFSSRSDQLKTQPIPDNTKPFPPAFTAGQFKKDDVTKLLGSTTVPDTKLKYRKIKPIEAYSEVMSYPLILIPDLWKIKPYTADQYTKRLGKVTVPDTKPGIRKTKPMDTDPTQYGKHRYSFCFFVLLLFFPLIIHVMMNTGNHTEKERKQHDPSLSSSVTKVREYTKPGVNNVFHSSQGKPNHTKKERKQYDPSLSSSVTKVREYTKPGVDSVFHISLGKSNELWVSDITGNLVQTGLDENQLKKIPTRVGYGYHTFIKNGDLIFTDRKKKIVYKITQDGKITEFIRTGNWEPISIHSSNIYGDILVGMVKGRDAKVTRYSETGKEIQNIQRNSKGENLYSDPHYITENINGDICISDYEKQAVVVVNKFGEYKFSYTGPGSDFYPFGIITDVFGHILVSDCMSNSVHVLDQYGEFLSVLLRFQKAFPCSLSLDEENDLLVGQWNTNTVTVYKYLPIIVN